MGEFPESVVEKAWSRSGGRCECTRARHGHSGRCNRLLLKSARGNRDDPLGWEAHHSISSGGETLSNCEILCWNPCYEATLQSRRFKPIAYRHATRI